MKISWNQYNGNSTEVQLGERRYELSDHLGNVQVVMSDRLAQADTGGSNAVDVFEGDVWSVMDYYPFGMLMRDRSANMEAMKLERSMFTDTVEVITYTKKTIDQPHPSTNAFQQPLDASNRKFKGKAWVSTTDQTANPDFADSTTTSSPIVYQYNGTSTEMHLAGLGYKSMRIEYNINSATVPALADNDSFVVQLTAIFDGSYKATRVEVRDHSSNQLIKQQVITNPPNNFGTPVFIGFSVGSLDSVDIIVRAEFTNTASYVPDTTRGVSNWTNGIYLKNWHLTHYRRNTKEEVISDTSDYFYRNKYAFGFNGMYRDDEVYGGGNSYDFGARVYNPRLGRWLSLDPLQSAYPFASPYNFALANPILFMDPNGKKVVVKTLEGQQMTLAVLNKTFGANGEKFSFNENNELQFSGDPSKFSTEEQDVLRPLLTAIEKDQVLKFVYEQTMETDQQNGESSKQRFDSETRAIKSQVSTIDPSEDHAIYREGKVTQYIKEGGGYTTDVNEAKRDAINQPLESGTVDGTQKETSNSVAARFFHSIGHFLYDTQDGTCAKVNVYENKARAIFKREKRSGKFKSVPEKPRSEVDKTHQ